MKSLFDKSFRYKPSFDTDLKKTFERLKREQKAREEQAAKDAAEIAEKVEHLPRKKAHG